MDLIITSLIAVAAYLLIQRWQSAKARDAQRVQRINREREYHIRKIMLASAYAKAALGARDPEMLKVLKNEFEFDMEKLRSER